MDADGAYNRKQALAQAEAFRDLGVTWFEEPVPADDLAGLRLLRDRGPAGMEIAAGEYGYDLGYFRRMLAAEAVDVLQADASRCGGITGFLQVASLCQAARCNCLRTVLVAACPSLLCHHPAPSSGVFSRPCPDRANAVRRCAGAGRWGAAPNLSRPGRAAPKRQDAERFPRLGERQAKVMSWSGAARAAPPKKEEAMSSLLKWALFFLVISLIAALFGFSGIATGAGDIARCCFYFLAVCAVLFVLAMLAYKSMP